MKLTINSKETISSLLKELEETFPNKIPINCLPELGDFRNLQGKQEVIQFIRNLVEPEEDDDTE